LLITLTTDFAKQSPGVGMMEAAIAETAPDARVIHYAHGLDDFDTTSAARVLETVRNIPPAIHVCVCDPGVGTTRRPLALLARRGDILIGPDNGVLLPAALALDGIGQAREITNRDLCHQPISPVFHGRDIFAPVAAHLANGVSFIEVGQLVVIDTLVPPPYKDAAVAAGCWEARVILVDKFGNSQLNIAAPDWQAFVVSDGDIFEIALPSGRQLTVEQLSTFGRATLGVPLLLPDNDGRLALAVNRGSFAATYGIKVGDGIVVRRAEQNTRSNKLGESGYPASATVGDGR
jgi:S-adenosyl-L-methionine hydrolase (adenosine-forming)